MPIATVMPTDNENPDTGQVGSIAVTSATDTGHGSTTASQVGGGSQTKACRWFTVSAGPASGIVSVTLKFDWTENGAILNDGANSFLVERSVDGGSNWTNIFTHSNVTSSTSSASQVVLSDSQDLTLVQVRDRLVASGGDVGDSASVTASISNIRIEVVTQDAGANQLLVMM